MNRYLHLFWQAGRLFGFDPVKCWLSLKGIPRFLRDLREYKRQSKVSDGAFHIGEFFPCLKDWTESCGSFNTDYFHQDLLVARRIFINNPVKHVDVGSRIDGFVAHVASFREIEEIDIRPLQNTIPNIVFRQADFMGALPPELHDYCDSISCLHAIEHFGLGRYGDPVCYDGYKKGIDNLLLMLKTGGKCYFSVPLGSQRVAFNGHRYFSARFLMNRFGRDCIIDRVSVFDGTGLRENVVLSDDVIDSNFGCGSGCIILEMTKK